MFLNDGTWQWDYLVEVGTDTVANYYEVISMRESGGSLKQLMQNGLTGKMRLARFLMTGTSSPSSHTFHDFGGTRLH